MLNPSAIRSLFLFLLIPITSLIFHWRVFHFDLAGDHAPRQALTQQNILNFYRYDFCILNPRTNVLDKDNERSVLRYEFPIMQWSVAMIFHLTGESFPVTRALMFLLGLFSVLGIFYWLRQIFDGIFTAWAGAWAFSFSPVFFYYTMNPMPDNLALAGTIWSLAFFFRFLKTGSLSQVALSAFFLGLATLAKLPYVIFIAAPGMWVLWSLFKKRFTQIRREILFSFVFLAMLFPALLWYLWVIPTWRNGVITGILENPLTREQLLDTLKFHLNEMFPERILGYCSIPFLLLALFYLVKGKSWKDHRFKWLAGTGLAVLAYWIFEFNMIGIVHDYYMIPFLPVLYLLIAFGIRRLMTLGKVGKWLTLMLLACMPVVTYNITKNYWSIEDACFVQDVFKYKDDLKNAAPDDARCIIINDPLINLFPYLIDKSGFVFRDDYLPADWVKDMIISHGATYMYSDSRKIDTDPEVSQYFEKMVMERGSVRVFELKKY